VNEFCHLRDQLHIALMRFTIRHIKFQ